MIPLLFNILFAFIPLIFFKTTSELFEFNKIIILYILTTLIVGVWLIKSISQSKLIFRRTILDWPLFIYLFIYLISTLLSIDPRTSVLGYYSRFNGGLISQICYALLYWAFVSNISAKQSLSTVYSVLISTTIVAIIGVLEHFGLFATCGLMNLGWHESCWVQDVKTRVFSTLGQPNWLAALIVALIPLVWSNLISNIKNQKENLQSKNINIVIYSIISILFFITLIFTGSRSGLLAFGIESILFWGLIFWKYKFQFLKHFLFLNFIFAFLFLIFYIIPNNKITNNQTYVSRGPALEVGGTESGTIRKYVWTGAVNVFRHYPILGTGPETFAHSFSMYKPIEHNLTSEWDFVYNKAHNEFLNYLANTGILGFLSYLSIIVVSLIVLLKSKSYDLLAGYVSILITNFFGFSVVPVSLLFFLLPAMAIVNSEERTAYRNNAKLNLNQKIVVVFLVLSITYSLFAIASYWLADIHYNKARLFNKSGNVASAKQEITKSLKFSPNEPLFLNELAVVENSIEISQKALSLSSNNINLVRSLAGIYNRNNKLEEAINTLLEETKNHPNDPKLYYQIGVYLIKLNNLENAKLVFIKSIDLKPNYKDARFALGLTYIDLYEFDKAELELKYILENIDPVDELTKKYLDNLIQAQK